MIEDLTNEKLTKYGFPLDTIERLETWENYSAFHHSNEGDFYACNSEKKIHTGIDALRKKYFGNKSHIAFPENCYPLMLEYYDLTFGKYLKQYSETKNRNYSNVDERQAELYFIENEITVVTNKIVEYENLLIKNENQLKTTPLKGIIITINKLHNNITEIQRYLDWLKNKKEGYHTFKELFEAAILNGVIEKQKNELALAASESLRNFEFNDWLYENKGWDRSREHYIEFLTKENLKEFLVYKNKQHKELQEEYKKRQEKEEIEKESWQISPKIDPALRRKKIITHLYNDLKKRCAAYLAELNNPLATELDYIDKEITLLKAAITELTERNNIQHNGGASDLEYKRINLSNQLMVAEQLKTELFPMLTEIKDEQPIPDIKPIFKPEVVKTKAEQPISEISRTKQFISEQLEAIDKNEGWKYAFKNENDYGIFLDLLTNHFEYKPYNLPENVIKLKKDCKTRFAKILRPIHKELSESPLKSDKEFLNFIRVLNHFEKLSDTEIYQAITR